MYSYEYIRATHSKIQCSNFDQQLKLKRRDISGPGGIDVFPYASS